MTDQISVSISPADIQNSLSRLDGYRQLVTQGITTGVNVAAMDTVTLAKENCPVSSGELQESIEVQQTENGEGMISSSAGSSVNYAVFVELGHRTRGGKSSVAPQPFLFPAFEENSQKMLDLFQSIIGGGQ